MAEQETAAPASNYTPVDQRADIGQATEDRRSEQIRQDRMYQAVMPELPESEYDSRIQSLEAQVRARKRDREFGRLETVEERSLFTLKELRAADERQADHEAAVVEWVKDVQPQLDRLKELRGEFTSSPNWKGSDVAEIDRTVIQFSTLGSDLAVAAGMLEKLEAKYQTSLEQAEFETAAEIEGLKNRIAELRAKKKKPEPEPTTELTGEDALFREAQATWNDATQRGEYDEAKRLRNVYWSERFKRGGV